MGMQKHAQKDSLRKRLLAVVHIAKKELSLDDDDYQQIICSQCKCSSGSAADCSDDELRQVVKYFERLGWNNKKRRPTKSRRKNSGNASIAQVNFARAIWGELFNAGIVRDSSESAFRRFVRSQTRRYHPQKAGYDDLSFAPGWVAQRVIEHLKQWADRSGVEVRSEHQ